MVEGSRNGSQYKLYSGDNLPVSKFSNSYTISFWVYINDYKYSLKENKYILMKGNKDEDNDSPIIYLTPYQNNLVVRVKLQSQEDPTQFETDELKTESATNVNQTLKEDSSVSKLNNNNIANSEPTSNTATKETTEPSIVPQTPTIGSNSSIENTQLASGDQFMNLPVKDNFESVEAFGNISNNSAPPTSVSYNSSFFTDINGENLKEEEKEGEGEEEEKGEGEGEGFTNHIPEINSQSSNTDNSINHSKTENISTNNHKVEDKYDECMIQNIPLQKWVHVAVGVYNNVLDIYQDGKLKSSCVLRGFPEPPTGEIHLTPFGGFSGKIASVSGFNKSISQDMAYQIYREGPNKTGLYSFFSNLITFK
jgi:hypothetical protein